MCEIKILRCTLYQVVRRPAGTKSFCPNSYNFRTKLCTTTAYESSVTTYYRRVVT